MAPTSLKIILVPLSSLHVGGEPGLKGLELAVARDSTGKPFIPSTTVRGVLRTAAYLASDLAGIPACKEREPEEIARAHRQLFGGGNKLCPVCSLWGAPRFESALRVSDFRLASLAVASLIQSATRGTRLPHVEIEDYTGRARTGALYIEEVVPAGTPFTGEVFIDTGLVSRRVAEGLVGGVKDKCTLYKLLIASLLLAPVIGVGRGSAPTAFFIENPPGSIDECEVAPLTGPLEWRGFNSFLKLVEEVFSSIPERIELVKSSLRG